MAVAREIVKKKIGWYSGKEPQVYMAGRWKWWNISSSPFVGTHRATTSVVHLQKPFRPTGRERLIPIFTALKKYLVRWKQHRSYS